MLLSARSIHYVHNTYCLFVVERHEYQGRERYVAFMRSISNERSVCYRVACALISAARCNHPGLFRAEFAVRRGD